MPCLLVSLGHQQPQYELYSINLSLSSKGNVFSYLCHLNVQAWDKMWIQIYVPPNNSVHIELFSLMRNIKLFSTKKHRVTSMHKIRCNAGFQATFALSWITIDWALTKAMKWMCERYSHLGLELNWTHNLADGNPKCYLGTRGLSQYEDVVLPVYEFPL